MKGVRLLVLAIGLSFAALANSQVREINTLREEIVQDLKGNILPFWINHDIDPNGGFYGSLMFDGQPKANDPKGGVLNARILWSFSSGYRLFGNKEYLELANRAQRYFIDHFIDKKYGGTYWLVRADGAPLDSIKQAYGIAYGIYGLSEHFRATGNIESLQKAIELYETLENHVKDPVNDGYIDSFTRSWGKAPNLNYDGTDVATKTMNTHIHVLEAYTSLYRVWRDAGLRERLAALIHIVSEKLYNPVTHHLILYCDSDWKNLNDIDSYGHDIETSWLLSEAVEVLGDEVLKAKIDKIAVDMVETALKEGGTPDGGIIYERNGSRYQRYFSWWCQTETVLGCINAWQITGNKKFLDSAIKTWTFIKIKMIDHIYGEWYSTVSGSGETMTKDAKASIWRCPYHNTRMGYEVYTRLGKLN